MAKDKRADPQRDPIALEHLDRGRLLDSDVGALIDAARDRAPAPPPAPADPIAPESPNDDD